MFFASWSKLGFLVDLIQLAFSSNIGRIIAGVILLGLAALVIYGKILNAQEAQSEGARSEGARNDSDGVRLDK